MSVKSVTTCGLESIEATALNLCETPAKGNPHCLKISKVHAANSSFVSNLRCSAIRCSLCVILHLKYFFEFWLSTKGSVLVLANGNFQFTISVGAFDASCCIGLDLLIEQETIVKSCLRPHYLYATFSLHLHHFNQLRIRYSHPWSSLQMSAHLEYLSEFLARLMVW